jgi:flagellar basal-body rod protein FlgB
VELFDTTQIALERALAGSSLRQQALANNIANANTPGYQRVDVDFHQALADALQGAPRLDALQEAPTLDALQSSPTLDALQSSPTLDALQSSPTLDGLQSPPTLSAPQDPPALAAPADPSQLDQVSFAAVPTPTGVVEPDGNTVDIDHEMASLTENSLEYQALTSIMHTRLGMLQIAIGTRTT